MSNISKKAIKNMEAIMKQSKINAGSNTDEQALQVASLYPDWNDYAEGETLTAGSRLNYDGKLYKVLQTHQKQATWTPAAAPSLFAPVLVSEDPDEILPWEQPGSTNGYMKGDRVTHIEKTWESLVDNNVWEPGAVGTETLWIEVTE